MLMENGDTVYQDLEGFGGDGGVMIKGPHYIGLRLDKVIMKLKSLGLLSAVGGKKTL